jgi:hypothetical protein
MWTSPSDRPEPFGTCGELVHKRLGVCTQPPHTLGPLVHNSTGATTTTFFYFFIKKGKSYDGIQVIKEAT